jgi:uncharacterized membrane protein YfcA
MEILGYLSAVLMGGTLGIFGGGGSILTVPILVILFGIAPVLATGYSLLVVGITSALGVWTYHRRKQVDWITAAWFAPPATVGVYLARRYLIPIIPEHVGTVGEFSIGRDHLIMLLFAFLMISAAVSMLLPTKETPRIAQMDKTTRGIIVATEGLVVGVITGIVGAGGGFLVIPALVFLVGMSLSAAVGTSLVVITVKSLVGFLGDISRFGEMNFLFISMFAVLAGVGMILGSFFAARIPVKRLKPAFGIFLMAMAGIVFWQTFFA